MSSTNRFLDVCRTCLAKNTNMKSLFSMEKFVDRELELAEMLRTCASVSITRDDGLSKNMCLTCIDDLQKAFSFKVKCEKSDVVLRQGMIIDSSERANDLITVKNEGNADNDVTVENTEIIWQEENTMKNKTQLNLEVEDLKSEIQTADDILQKPTYKCLECNESYESDSYLNHMVSVHWINVHPINGQGAQKVLTEQPPPQHKQTSPKKKPSKIVEDSKKDRTCKIRNKTFKYPSNKVVHTKEKPPIICMCNICGKGFTRPAYLRLHFKMHTGDKPFKCITCSESFTTSGSLKVHIRTHTGEKPYVCKTCGRRFAQSGNLRVHKLHVHGGEKSVECEICHRRFYQKGRLTEHMRIHTGGKPYSCTDCGSCFRLKTVLDKHKIIHIGEKPFLCNTKTK